MKVKKYSIILKEQTKVLMILLEISLYSIGTLEKFQLNTETSQERSHLRLRTLVGFKQTGFLDYPTIVRLKWSHGLILENQLQNKHSSSIFLITKFSQSTQEVANSNLENKWN
jgi:hypothetical protein